MSRRRGPGSALPSVNLLPAHMLEALQLRALRLRFIVPTIAVALVLVTGYIVAAGQLHTDQNALATQQNRQSQIAAEYAALAPVTSFYAALTQTREQIAVTMAKEVLFSQIAERVLQAALGHVEIRSSAFAADTSPVAVAGDSAACAGSDPYVTIPASGCLTISGNTGSRAELNAFLADLASDDRFSNPFISTTTTDATTGGVLFTASVTLTAKIYSGRYADDAFLGVLPQ